jgi:hypothetical protein
VLGDHTQASTRRVHRAGVIDSLRKMALEAYDQMVGLEPSELTVDNCISKVSCGGEKSSRSPVDCAKRGIKRSVLVDGRGNPLRSVTATATAATTHQGYVASASEPVRTVSHALRYITSVLVLIYKHSRHHS